MSSVKVHSLILITSIIHGILAGLRNFRPNSLLRCHETVLRLISVLISTYLYLKCLIRIYSFIRPKYKNLSLYCCLSSLASYHLHPSIDDSSSVLRLRVGLIAWFCRASELEYVLLHVELLFVPLEPV